MDHPFLIGETIYLRGLEPGDIDGPYAEWLNDQESDFYTGHAIWPNSSTKMRGFLERVCSSKNDLVLAIVDRKTDRHIGNVGLHNIDWVNRNCKMAILVGEKSMRGGGRGTEAVKMVCDHAFQRLNLHRIYLGVREDNVPAVRAYIKAGFTEEGRMVQSLFSRGQFYDIISMYKLAETEAEMENL